MRITMTKRGLRSSRKGNAKRKGMAAFRLPLPPNPHGPALLQMCRAAKLEQEYDKAKRATTTLTDLLNISDAEMKANIKFTQAGVLGDGVYQVFWRPTGAKIGEVVRTHERLWHIKEGRTQRGEFKNRQAAATALVVESKVPK